MLGHIWNIITWFPPHPPRPPTHKKDVDNTERTQQKATKMARGWEHPAKEERLREMGFITLSGTGEDGARLLWGWVLGGGDTTRINGKRGDSGWIEPKILPGDSWALDQGSEGWRDLSPWRFSRIGWTKPCTMWSEFGIYPAGAGGWTEDLLRSVPAQMTPCFVSRCQIWLSHEVYQSLLLPVFSFPIPNLTIP